MPVKKKQSPSAKKTTKKNSAKKTIAKKTVVVKSAKKTTKNKVKTTKTAGNNLKKTSKKNKGKKPVSASVKRKTGIKKRKTTVKKSKASDLELNMFKDFSSHDFANLEKKSPSVEKPVAVSPQTDLDQKLIADNSTPQEKDLVQIKISSDSVNHQSNSNILDLKEIKQDNFSDLEKNLTLQIEKDPYQTFLDIFDGKISYNKYYFKQANFLHKILNISTISWIVYLGMFLHGLLKKPALMSAGFFVFLGKALGGYFEILINFFRLLVKTISGQTRFNRESFLYPERALLNLSLFGDDSGEKKQFAPFLFSPATVKSLAVFVVLALLVALPIKGIDMLDGLQVEKARVLGASETAYSSLQLAMADIQSFSWLSASEHFSQSRDQFENLSDEFDSNHSFLKKILMFIPSVRDKLNTAEGMMSIGVDISLLGEELSELLHLLQESDDSITLTQKISAIKKSTARIKLVEQRVSKAFSQVTISALSEDIQEEVSLLKSALPELFSKIDQVDDLMDFAYKILGGDKQQRYVLIFQNSDEIRPSGGFLGSLSILDIYQGKIINTETPTGGPYDWQGWLTKKTIAPEPLWIVNPNWQFQDANWFFDYPTSVAKILDFYYQTRPEVVDGVIAINSYLLPEILKITGEIEMPDYEKTLTSENVLLEIQKAVELEYDPEKNEPKKIIGDLFFVLQEKLTKLDSQQFILFLEVLNNALVQKDVQMYFTDKSLEQQVFDWGWGGEIKDTPGDYLAVVNTNIAGAKTDRFMLQDLDLKSEIAADGSIINTLRIKRANDGIPGDVFYGHNNVNYLRVYVPVGSELLAAEGDFEKPADEYFEKPSPDLSFDSLLKDTEQEKFFDEEIGLRQTDEFNKTVFGFWLQTNLGETSEVVLRYRLPFKARAVSSEPASQLVSNFNKFLINLGLELNQGEKIWHSLYWQKQSGQHNNNSVYTLVFPEEWEVEYLTRPGFSESGQVEYQFPLDQDFKTGFLFGG